MTLKNSPTSGPILIKRKARNNVNRRDDSGAGCPAPLLGRFQGVPGVIYHFFPGEELNFQGFPGFLSGFPGGKHSNSRIVFQKTLISLRKDITHNRKAG